MYKVINGKRYDTETARKLGEWDNGTSPDNFKWISETIYKTKSGNFFLHGEGGPLTPYATVSGNDTGWGKKITPLSEEQARAWSEDRLSGEEYDRIFGTDEFEESEFVQISATIPEELKTKMDEIRKRTGETTSEFLSRLIKEC